MPGPPPAQWFTAAGFTDIQLKRIGPSWYRGVRRHGLIMGCSVTARKPTAGASPLALGPKAEVSAKSNTNPLAFVLRVLLGSVGGAWGPRQSGCSCAAGPAGLLLLVGRPADQCARGRVGRCRWLAAPGFCTPLLYLAPSPRSPCPGLQTGPLSPSSVAGFWYFLLPIYMFLKNLVWPRSGPLADKF